MGWGGGEYTQEGTIAVYLSGGRKKADAFQEAMARWPYHGFGWVKDTHISGLTHEGERRMAGKCTTINLCVCQLIGKRSNHIVSCVMRTEPTLYYSRILG